MDSILKGITRTEVIYVIVICKEICLSLIKAEIASEKSKKVANHHSAGENGETKTTATSVFN